MERSLNRRTLSRALMASGLAAGARSSLRNSVAARQTSDFSSGGIGLSRSSFERTFGPGEATQTYARYTDPAYGGPVYVGYDFVNHPDGMISFLEVQWSEVSQAGGIAAPDAATQVQALLPSDAILLNRYWMGATPGGPISLTAETWSSDSLALLRGGKPTMIAIYQERMGSLPGSSGMDVIVTAATISVEQ